MMEQSLVEAAQAGNIDALYGFLQQNPYLLDKLDEIPFLDNPLHIAAASAGSTHFAVEVLNLKPSFSKKLNPDGFSPLDLALHYGNTHTVRRLVDFDPELVRVKGKERFTALHYVAEVGDEDLLAEFLVRCPKSIEDLTIRGETAVHVAVRNGNVRALKVLLGWLQLTENEQILNWEDENGDTVLHIAASTRNFEVVRLLIEKVSINHKNQEGLTALDIVVGRSNSATATDGRIKRILQSTGAKRSSSLPKNDSLADILISKVSSKRKLFGQKVEGEGSNLGSLHNLSGETRNALLVVAVLITTATYQAILSPPGGISSGSDNSPILHDSLAISPTTSTNDDTGETGTANLTGKVQMGWPNFSIFLILNTIPFFASLGMIVALLPRTHYNSLLVVPLLSLSLSYAFSAGIISPRVDALPSFSYALISFCAFVLMSRSTTVKYQLRNRLV
ncbi:hypothetical protein ACH5RR_021375 [Cinchona calisaya]|uniref:PGG domain-containing protein n=1 Tax=Cinchona calisaya TaxID=153742 RepID=A0ABD2ZIW5_9GENT